MKKEPSEGLIDFNVDQTDGDDLLIAEGFARSFSETVMKSSSKSIDIFNYRGCLTIQNREKKKDK